MSTVLTLFSLFMAALSSGEVVRSVDQAELAREHNIAGYTVTEHYKVTNSHFQTPAEMLVHTVYKRGEGKTYSVQSRSGPELLQSKVLDRLLASERDMSRGDTRAKSLLTSANYEFKPLGTTTYGGQECEMVELNPRSKSTFLVKGKAWLESKGFTLVRLEGRPTASPSFFAGHPLIVRDYQNIDGFAFAKQSRATTENFLMGKTEILIQYSDYQIQRD